MELNGNENLDSILLHDSTTLESITENLAELINTRFVDTFDLPEKFNDTDSNDEIRINQYIDFLQRDLSDNESCVTVFNSRNDSNETEINKSTDSALPIVQSHIDRLTTFSALPPSDSANDSQIKCEKLHLIYPLEYTYRPRYKSDYFPQNGTIRKPRYIADSAGNHFISLQLPSIDECVNQNLYIRIALITKSIEGHGHYYSPYKFQKDHNDIRVPDENPTYIKVETSEQDKFVMRLQLVLIKSKLGQLNDAQPLQPFPVSDSTVSIQNIIHTEKLTPKDLITTYQLDQSQLAFSLCTKITNDSYEIYSDTTVISTVITEVSTTNKKSIDQQSTTTSDVETTPRIQCPHCAHYFNSNKRSKLTSTSSDNCTKKKKKSIE